MRTCSRMTASDLPIRLFLDKWQLFGIKTARRLCAGLQFDLAEPFLLFAFCFLRYVEKEQPTTRRGDNKSVCKRGISFLFLSHFSFFYRVTSVVTSRAESLNYCNAIAP